MASNPALVDLVFSNALLLAKITNYLKQPDLVKLCQVHKQACQTVILRLWKSPRLASRRSIEAFSHAVGFALPRTMGELGYYGGLVQILDFSTVSRWRNKLTCGLLVPIFQYCTQVKVLNLRHCRSISCNDLRRLISANAQLSRSLTSLNITGMCPFISTANVVFKLLPNVTKLVLNRTNINNTALLFVSQYMPYLEHLEIVKCGSITDVTVQKLATGCPKLAYLQARRCKGIHDTNLLQQISARGGSEVDYDDSGSDSDYYGDYHTCDYSDYSDYSDYDIPDYNSDRIYD